MKIIRLIYALVFAVAVMSSGAYAKTKPFPMAGGKHDARTPIEITSDTLEVMQEKNQAVFSGHVVAVQGDVRLTSDKMTVYYASSEDKSKAHAKAQDGKESSGQGAIKKIDADGHVFLATAAETASGTSGTYDVEQQEVRLNDHVVLTRGQNTLKGDHLTYSFATGKSKLTSGEGQVGSNGKKERVRAMFVPESKDKEKQQ